MWNATKNTDNVSLLEAFAGKYPESFYAELAKARIDELKRKHRLASLEASEPQTPKTDPSLEAWNAAKASENVSVLQAFVDNYPLSFYAEIAKARIEELKRKQLETAQQAMVQEMKRGPQGHRALWRCRSMGFGARFKRGVGSLQSIGQAESSSGGTETSDARFPQSLEG